MHRDSWATGWSASCRWRRSPYHDDLGIYALLLFAVTLHWLPAIGLVPAWAINFAICCCGVDSGLAGRLFDSAVRASMLEVLQENHVRTLGPSESGAAAGAPILVEDYHRAGHPVSPSHGSLLSNAVIIEIIFLRPGIGRLAYDAVCNATFPSCSAPS